MPQIWIDAAAVLLAAALLGGCASTQITSAWKDPGLSRLAFTKVLVVFQHADPQLRTRLERSMAAEIPNSVPAHAIFSDEEVRDIERVKARVRAEGFDSAVIMRIVGVDREVSYVPGRLYSVPAFYRGFYGYGMQTQQVETVNYKEGTLTIDLVDPKNKILVWNATAEGRVSKEARKNPGPAIDQVVTQMMAPLPARSGM